MPALIGRDIPEAAQLLRAGKVIAIPTETVYGLAGNALDARAVARIFAVKNRPSFDPLIIHVPSVEAIHQWVEAVPAPLQELARHFSPGPLTLVLPKKQIIPDLVTSGLPNVAVRVPQHPLTRSLLELLDFPLAAPSANPFGYISPTKPTHVQDQLGDKLPYILDGGPCQVGIESTIVGFVNKQVTILRKGGLSVEAIEEVVGPVQVQTHSSSNPAAPGMLKSHYAPRVPLRLIDSDEVDNLEQSDRVGLLTFQKELSTWEHQFALSPNGDLEEAAQQLFAYLRLLDTEDLDLILAERLPERGLGRAINDRLSRAAAEQ